MSKSVLGSFFSYVTESRKSSMWVPYSDQQESERVPFSFHNLWKQWDFKGYLIDDES